MTAPVPSPVMVKRLAMHVAGTDQPAPLVAAADMGSVVEMVV